MFVSRHRALLAWLPAMLTLASPTGASADDAQPVARPTGAVAPPAVAPPAVAPPAVAPPVDVVTQPTRAVPPPPPPVVQPVGVDLNRLATELDLFAAEARRNRLATTFTGIGMASALIPTGIILLSRTDGVSQAVVIGMIVGGSAQLVGVLAGFIPTRMDDIHKSLQERIAAHADQHATVDAIETGWRDAAAAGRTRRIRVGSTLLSVGLMSLGTGLTFLIHAEGIFGMSRKTQYTIGGIAMGTGIPVTTLGVHFLFEWSTEETAWEAYRTMKADGDAVLSRRRTPTVGVVPTPGGALAFTALAF